MSKTTEEMIKDKGLTAPRVTKRLINSRIIDEIVSETKTENGTTIYIGMYYMSNGFTVTGIPIVMGNGKVPMSDTTLHNIIIVTGSGSILRFAYKELDGKLFIGKPSASVSAENDNEEIGLKIARENLERNILLGYSITPIAVGSVDGCNEAMENTYSEIWAYEGYTLANELESNRPKFGYLEGIHYE